MLLAKLPRTPRVEGMTAHSVLHAFYGGADSLIAKLGALTERRSTRLRPPPRRTGRGRCASTTATGSCSPRWPPTAGPRSSSWPSATGWSPTTVRRRMTELREHGVLYLDIDVDLRLFGVGTRTLLWLSVAPAHLARRARRWRGIPRSRSPPPRPGPTNLYASVVCANQRELYRYLTTRVAALPAITHIETAPVIRTVKRAANQS